MTASEIDSMSPEELKVAVATTLGWTVSKLGWWSHPTLPDNGGAMPDPPAYELSLDCCAEFEKTLTDEEYWKYDDSLMDVVNDDYIPKGPARTWSIVSATAKQRCRAFLRVKSANL